MLGADNSLRRHFPALLCLLLFSAVHLIIVVYNHRCYRTFAFDYGVYNFAFYDYAHLRASPNAVYLAPFPITFMQDHFSLTLPLLSPLYWIFAPLTGTYTLLLIQWILIVAGGWFTYLLVRERTGSKWIPLAALIYYFVLFGRYPAYQNDCNLAIIGAAVIPMLLYAFEKRNLTGTVISFIFILINREDAALFLLFLMIFLYIVHFREQRQRTIALILAMISVAFFVVTFSVFIPMLEDENKKFSLFNYSALGADPNGALKSIVFHPIQTIELLFRNHSGNVLNDNVKWQFYLLYLVSGGFILLLRPVALIPFIPLIAKKMLNDDPLRWGVHSYHSVDVVSLLPVMVYFAADARWLHKIKPALCGIVPMITIVATVYMFSVSDTWKYDFYRSAFYKPGFDPSEYRKIMELIPADAAVSASCRSVPHLAFRDKPHYFPAVNDASYIFVFKIGDTYPMSEQDFTHELEKYRSSRDWHVVVETHDCLLLQRRTQEN